MYIRMFIYIHTPELLPDEEEGGREDGKDYAQSRQGTQGR
jgi:hypothetical protein